jgi:hypothetical protein
MNRLTSLSVMFALAIVSQTTPAIAQVDDRLLGTWTGVSDANEGARVTVERNHVLIDGERIPARCDGQVLVLGPEGDTERLPYTLRGDQLVLQEDGYSTTWQRVGGAQGQGGGGNPLRRGGDGGGGNPLAKRAPADPFVRAFRGDGLELELQGRDGEYRGTLAIDGTKHPVSARKAGENELSGNFRVGNDEYGFSARLDRDALTLESGGSVYRLQGEPMKEAGSVNPLQRRRPARRPSTILRESDLALDLPQGWTVMQNDASGALINPGFQNGQRLDVTMSIHCVANEPEDVGVPVDRLLLRDLGDVRQSLRSQGGLETSSPTGDPRRFDVNGVPAASVQMPCRTADGRSGIVWVAARIEGEKAIVALAIYLEGNERTHAQRVEQVFASAMPASAVGRGTEGAEDRPFQDDAHDEVIDEIRTREIREDDRFDLPPTRRGGSDGQGPVVLRKHTFKDAGMGGMDSHTMLVPQGWQVEGGVRWTNHPSAYVHFVANASAPGSGAGVSCDFDRTFRYADPQTLARMGQQLGHRDPDGTVVMTPPQQAGDTALYAILPALRPSATDVRMLDARTCPDAEQAFRQLLGPVMQQLESQPDTQTWLHCEVVRVEYQEGGRRYEEEIAYNVFGSHFMTRTEFLNMDQGMWFVNGVRSLRAPKGRLEEERGVLTAVLGSLRETPQWSTARHELAMKIARIRHEGNMQRIRDMGEFARSQARQNSELSDAQMAAWRDRQASQDRIHKQTIHGIREVNEWNSANGGTLTVDMNYQRVFEDPLGNVVMTNDPSYDPGTDPSLTGSWTELNRSRN